MTDSYCLWCGRSLRRESSFRHLYHADDVVCHKCRHLMHYRPRTVKIDSIKVDSLYVYEGLTREMIIQYKELNDEALFPVFLYPYADKLRRKYRGYTLVPIPSSEENNRKRGFRAVDMMFSLLDNETVNMLVKKDSHDQKNTDFKRRHEIGRHLLLEKKNTANNRILLVDDIVTTGETLKAAAKMLQREGYCVRVCTICYNRRFVKV